MTKEKQEKILMFIKEHDRYVDIDWMPLVNRINDIIGEYQTSKGDIDINLERAIDELALKSAWLYRRLGDYGKAKRIRKALGYTG